MFHEMAQLMIKMFLFLLMKKKNKVELLFFENLKIWVLFSYDSFNFGQILIEFINFL